MQAQNQLAVIVLGIDPGLANTGYGVVSRAAGRLLALDGGVIETAAALAPELRLAAGPRRPSTSLLGEHEPDAVALEELYFGQNVRTAFAVGQARGVVMLAAGQHGVPCTGYTPQQVKAAVCGSGRRRQGPGRPDGEDAALAGEPSRAPTMPPTRSRWRSATPTGAPLAMALARVGA